MITFTATGCGSSNEDIVEIVGPKVVLTSIEVTPVDPTIASGTSQQFTATGNFSNGAQVDITDSVVWSVGDANIASVSNTDGTRGVATGIDPGITNVIAAADGVQGQTSLTVSAATVTTIAVVPANATIASGTTLQYTATATFSDGTTQDISQVATWDSSNETAATIDADGLVTAVTAGQSTISATFGGVTGQTNLTVAVPASITVTPADPTIALGTSQQFIAVADFGNGVVQDVTSSATWSTVDDTVATASNAAGSRGRVTGIAVGTTDVRATFNGIQGDTGLTVSAATVTSIAVNPQNTTLPTGSTLQYTAVATLSDATTQIISDDAVWASSNLAAATVGVDGLVTTFTPGQQTTISATFGGVTGNAFLSVTAVNPDNTTISISGLPTTVTDGVDLFQILYGGAAENNGVAAGPLPDGFRRINWDAVPGGSTNVDNFPGDFFRVSRGLVMSTPGTGFRVSDVDFNDVNATYGANFDFFTTPRTFSPVGSNITDLVFTIPGTLTPATVSGFGVIFSDVEVAGSTSVEYFGPDGASLGVFQAPVKSNTGNHSFVGAQFSGGQGVARVRITSGNAAIGAGVNDISDGGTADLVIMDDFLFGEPQAVDSILIAGSGPLASDVAAYGALLGLPNNGTTAGPFVGGFRRINWDGVPGANTNNDTFPGNFFNVRGLEMSTPGTGLRVSDNDFNDVDPDYGALFNAFTAPRTIAAVGSNQIIMDFVVPGTTNPASTNGFGAVFSNVAIPGASTIEFFNDTDSLGVFNVPIRSDAAGLSFLGGRFTVPVTRAVVTVGQAALGNGVEDISNGGVNNLSILDDFLYGEPVVLP